VDQNILKSHQKKYFRLPYGWQDSRLKSPMQDKNWSEDLATEKFRESLYSGIGHRKALLVLF